jgi:hypothetical protein
VLSNLALDHGRQERAPVTSRRDLVEFVKGGARPDAPWIAKMSNITCLGKLWDERLLLELAKASPNFGHRMNY